MVWDFHRFLGVELEEAYWVKSWKWFVTRIPGILSQPEGLLRLALNKDKESGGE